MKIVIARASIAKTQVSGLTSQTYTGSALTPAPTVTLGGRTLAAGTDYTVGYRDNVKTGTATVSVTGTGNYTGTAKGSFVITLPQTMPAEVSPSSPVDTSVVEQQVTKAKSDADQKDSTYALLRARAAAKGKTSVKVSWSKVKGATSYVVYGNKCGKNNRMKKLATVKGTSWTQKKLKKGTYYKYLVIAVRDGGAVATSKTIHVATAGGKVGNHKAVTTAAKKGKVTLKRGKTFKLKAKAVAASTKLKVKKHRGLAFETTNKKVATVSKKGVIKAVGKGSCYVYAYAQNGVYKRVKVTVK